MRETAKKYYAALAEVARLVNLTVELKPQIQKLLAKDNGPQWQRLGTLNQSTGEVTHDDTAIARSEARAQTKHNKLECERHRPVRVRGLRRVPGSARRGFIQWQRDL
jgi:hypothetical protein